jgi:hypothetical protein
MAPETTLSRSRKGWIEFLAIAAAGPLVAVFGGMLRGPGELERRIVSGALASFGAGIERFSRRDR